jgi:hypothetical protein
VWFPLLCAPVFCGTGKPENAKKTRLVSRHLIILFVCLLGIGLSGCQPYPDSAEPIYDFRSESVDFGKSRELRLARFEADRKSLLLEFNQPIQSLQQDESTAPFAPKFIPRVPIRSAVREGAAGVRITFADELPSAQRYFVVIPSGWRALTGASFLRSETLEWVTSRPTLTRISASDSVDNWEPSQPLRLHFNQPVTLNTVSQLLTIHSVPEGKEVGLARPLDLRRIEEDDRIVELRLPSLGPQRYILSLAEGVKATQGRVLGERSEDFYFGSSSSFRFLSEKRQTVQAGRPMELRFSEKVAESELRRYLKGLSWGDVVLVTEDELEYKLFWPSGEKGSRPSHLTILPGLASHSGQLLSETVEIVVDYQEVIEDKPDLRPFMLLQPGQTVLEMASPKGTKLATWTVKPSQVLQLMSLPDESWQSVKKLPHEQTKPVFVNVLKKAGPRTRFLKRDAIWQEKRKHGMFLVRVAQGDSHVRRYLVLRTGLSMDVVFVNHDVNVHVETRAGDFPRNAKLHLLDSEGRVLEQKTAEPERSTLLKGPWKSEPRAVLAQSGSDRVIRSLQPLRLTTNEVSPGILWADAAVVESGAELVYFGLWWAETERPAASVVDRTGKEVLADVGPAEQLGIMFRGRLKAPQASGEYTLELPLEDSTSPRFHFIVTDHPVKNEHPSHLSLSQGEDGRFRGRYAWDGPGADHLGVRAALRPRLSETDGWRRVIPGQPRWIPSAVKLEHQLRGGTFEVEALPVLPGPWNLVVELFDARDPKRVFHRQVERLSEESLVLAQISMKPLTSDTRFAKFRFLFKDGKNNESRSLSCRLSIKEFGSAEGWKLLQEGDADWKNGAYEWTAGVRGFGRVKLECLFTDAGGRGEVNWETVLEPDSVTEWDSLELSDEVVLPGVPLGLKWPGLKAGASVWLMALSGEGLLDVSYRTVEKDGDLGNWTLTKVSPGTKEIVILATRNPAPDSLGGASLPSEIRANRVGLVSAAYFLGAALEVNGDFTTELEVEPDEVLKVRLEHRRAALREGLVWWEQRREELDPDAPRAFVRERLQQSTNPSNSTIHGTLRLPVVGPFAFPEDHVLPIKVPNEPGTYQLMVVAEDDESAIVFAERTIEVKPSARWSPLIPRYVRPGDLFSAGVRFWSDPEELARTGATTSVVLDSTLLPVSYFNTAALVEPGSFGDMLFSYAAPGFIADIQRHDYKLKWELGVEGQAWPVDVELTPLPTLTQTSLYRRRELQDGQALRLNLDSLNHWKLRLLSEGESAVVEVAGQSEEVLEVRLNGQEPAKEFMGRRPILEIKHRSGGRVLVEVIRLEPNEKVEELTAEGLYLLRRLEDKGGVALEKDRCEMGAEYLVSHHLVVPEAIGASRLQSPLPGGVEALGCWLKRPDGLRPVSWEPAQGGVVIDIPELEPGEHEVLVSISADIVGVYRWPGASVIAAEDDTLLAQTAPGEVTIVRK